MTITIIIINLNMVYISSGFATDLDIFYIAWENGGFLFCLSNTIHDCLTFLALVMMDLVLC